MVNRCFSNARLTEATQRLAAYYDKLARTQSENGLSGYNRLDADRPQIMRVMEACASQEQWETVAELVSAIENYFHIQGHWIEQQTALEMGIEATQKQGNRHNEGAFLGNLGEAYRELGQVEKAIAYHEQALVIARELGDCQSEWIRLGNLGNAYRELGQVEKAIAYQEQALAIAREIGDRRSEGIQLGNLGNAYHALGQVEKAIAYHEQALAIDREIGYRQGEGDDLANLGLAYRELGQVQKAIEYYEQALAIFEEIKSPNVDAVQKWLDELE